MGDWKGYFAKEHMGWELLLQPSFETQSTILPKALLPVPQIQLW